MICGVFSLIHKKNLYPYSLSIYLLWLPLNIIYNLLTPILKRNNLKVALKSKTPTVATISYNEWRFLQSNVFLTQLPWSHFFREYITTKYCFSISYFVCLF